MMADEITISKEALADITEAFRAATENEADAPITAGGGLVPLATPDLAASFLSRLPPHAASLHLTHNQHKAYYETVEQWEAHHEDRCQDWVSDEQRAKAIAANDVWELQWYPITPIGSYCLLACDLGALLEAAGEVAADDATNTRTA